MTVGSSGDTEIGVMGGIFQQQPFSIGQLWAKRHIGDPGGVGTTSPAADARLVNVSSCFGTAAAVSGAYAVIVNDAVMGPWLAVTAAETYTHISFWTLSSGGVFVGSGLITSAAVSIGDNWSVPIGGCTIKRPIAA